MAVDVRRTIGLIAKVVAAVAGVWFLLEYLEAERPLWTPHGETEFTGKAIESNTGRPLANVWVIATYILTPGGIHHQATCSVTEVVRSNELGEYILPFHDGLPPQFIDAFGKRYRWAPWDRYVTKDQKIRWIVEVLKDVDGRREVVGTEGPFGSEQEALKASRILQDVWLKPFKGSDEEWLEELVKMSRWFRGCASIKTRGGIGWEEALLAEAESFPDSSTKTRVLEALNASLATAIEMEPYYRSRGLRNPALTK